MKLEKKKDLIARALGVGKNRLVLNNARLPEIKEAITRQDIKDLLSSGAINVKEKKGRKKNEKKTARRREGSFRQKNRGGKTKYVILTRKLRGYLKNMKIKGKSTKENYLILRKEIRASEFKSLAHFKERIKTLEVVD